MNIINLNYFPICFVARAHFFRVLCFMALCLLSGLTPSFALAAESVDVLVDGSAPTPDAFSEHAMETRINAIQARCLQNENCAARNAPRFQLQADAVAKAKKARAQRTNTRTNTKGAPLSAAQLAQRKQEYDTRCDQNKKCAARKTQRDARRETRAAVHQARDTVSRAFKAWCAAHVAACGEYKAIQKTVFERITALQPDCETHYNHCVTSLRPLIRAQRDAWQPFCNAQPSLCNDQKKVSARNKTTRHKERTALCQAQPALAVCDASKRNFSTALKEASDSI